MDRSEHDESEGRKQPPQEAGRGDASEGHIPIKRRGSRQAAWRRPALWLGAALLWGSPSAAWAQGASVDILDLWRTQSEQRAIDVLRKQVKAHGAEWREFVVSGFPAVKDEFARRKSTGRTPNVVSWVLGREVKAMADRGLTRTITSEREFFESQIAPDLLKLVAGERGLSGVPIGLHIQNQVIYNRDLLNKYQLRQPADWIEFLGYGPNLKRDGVYLIANSDEPWQIRNMFMSIFSSLANADDAHLLLSGGQPLHSLHGKFSKAVDIMMRLKEFAEPQSRGRKWEETVRLVEAQRSLAVALGDYIIPEFNDSANIACGVAPGAKYIIWGADTLIFPTVQDPRLIAGQNLVFKILADRDTLLQFSYWKGSIPAIKDAPTQSLRPCTAVLRQQWEAFSDKILVDADSWNRRLGALGSILNRLWNQSAVDPDAAASNIVEVLDAIR